jgi:hypothetical protein
MRQRLARRGLVDHRRQYHEAVDPDLLGVDGIAAGQRRRVLGDAGEDGHAALHRIDGELEDLALLVSLERAVLAHRAQHNEAVHAGAQEPLDMRRRGREIDGLVRLEVSGDRRVHTLPLRHGLPFFDLVLRPAERCHSRPGQSIRAAEGAALTFRSSQRLSVAD